MGLKLASLKRRDTSEGEWQDVPEWPGVSLCVCSINKREYQIARELLVQKRTRELGRSPANVELEPALGGLVSTHLLRGWKGIVDDDGKAIEWTSALGEEYLTNPDYAELEQQTIMASIRAGRNDVEFVKDAIKN